MLSAVGTDRIPRLNFVAGQSAGSGHRRHMSQDIGDTCLGSSATPSQARCSAMPQSTSKARLVITALFVDHQSPAGVAARYGVHRAWVYKLKARYEAEGDAAIEPRSRRPKTSPTALSPESVDLIVRVRKELSDAGLDADPDTIAWDLEHHHGHGISRSTISRHLSAAGLLVPRAQEATEVLPHPVRGLDAEPDLAVRLHPLPTHPSRWPTRHRRQDQQLARRLHPLRPASHRAPPDHHPDRQARLSSTPQVGTASQPRP
jgi:transposase